MTPRRPRDIGTHTETAVVRYLRGAGFDQAERRSLRGFLDAGDITGTPGVAWSVKGGVAAKTASDGQVTKWLAELERQRVNAAAEVAVLVLQRAGIGEANAGRWWAVVWFSDLMKVHDDEWRTPVEPWHDFPTRMHLADVCTLLRAAGYGQPLREQIGVD
jgi:hypothetical protein